jgi:polygalacturonase
MKSSIVRRSLVGAWVALVAGCIGDAPADDVSTVVEAATGTCSWRNTAAITVAAPWGNVTFTPPTIPCNIFNITSYGGVGNGTTSNTTAFKNAIAAAVAAGGGVIDVPSGTWLTGPIVLKSNIELHLESGSTIKFSQTFSDYLPVVLTRWEGLDVNNFSPFIYALSATNVAVSGTGTIDGQGSAWWGWKSTQKTEDQNVYNYYISHLNSSGVLSPIPAPPTSGKTGGLRPTMIECNKCTNFLVESIKTQNSPYWNIHPLYSSNVIIRNANITSNSSGSNGDGIDPDSSTNVLITNNTFATSDDNISIKSGLNEDGIAVAKPSSGIVIQNNTSTTGHGGAVIGSEMSGGVNNVSVKSNTFKGLQRPVYIKTLPGRGGTVSNVWWDTLTIGWSTDALDVTTNYGSSSIPPHNTKLLPTVKNVTIQNITATGTAPVYEFIGLSGSPFSGIVLNNVHLTGTNGTCTTAAGIKLTNTTLTGVPSGSTTLPCQ